MLLLSFTPATFAHSHLESSTPANGEVVTENVREIVLTFNGEIEQGSTIELLDAKRKVVAMEEIMITDNKVIGSIPNGLKNDKYTVVWSIISADGHQMDGEFAFEVNLAETELTTPSNNSDEESNNKTSDNRDTLGNDESEEDEELEGKSSVTENTVGSDQVNNERDSNLIPFIIVGLLLTIMSIFIVLRRKNK